MVIKCALPSLEVQQAQGIGIRRDIGGDSQDEDVSNDTMLFRCASNHSDAYHDTLIVSWAKQLDNSARNGDEESSEQPNVAVDDDHGRQTSSTPPASVSIPLSCLYALFLKSTRQQLDTIFHEVVDLHKSKARIAGATETCLTQRNQVVDKIAALKKDKEDLMEELTTFGEEAGIQVQGL